MQLFDRLGKRFVPTEAGRIYLENAREMLRYQERCRAQLGDLRQGSTGSVRFGIHPRRTLFLLAPALKAYAPSHPWNSGHHLRAVLGRDVPAAGGRGGW